MNTDRWALFLPMKAQQDKLKNAARTHGVITYNMVSVETPKMTFDPWGRAGAGETIKDASLILEKIQSLPLIPTH